MIWFGVSPGSGRVVELGHEVTVGGAGSGEVIIAFFELQPQVSDLLLEARDLLVESVDIGWGAESGLAPGMVTERLGQALFQVLDSGVEPGGGVGSGEQVRLQRGSGDGRTGVVAHGRFGLEGVDLLQQVAVPVEERPVDRGGASDTRRTDLGALGGGAVERGGDALAAAGGVGMAALPPWLGRGGGGYGGGAGGVGGGRCGCGGPEGRHAEGDGVGCTVTADHGDGFADLGLLGVIEAGDVALDPGDQVPDPDDLLLGRGGVGAGPLIAAVDGGGQPFAGAQQVLQVCLQVGQERDIGLEVVAAGAAEPDGAGAATGLDVGGLAAGAIRHGDLPDRVTGTFGFQQGPGVTPDPVAVPVEAERGDLVDGVTAAVFADPVIAPGHGVASVIKKFGQYVDGDTGVGMPLGITVPVGIGHDLDRVEHGSVAAAQGRHGADPVTVPGFQGRSADRLVPVRVPVGGGQQLQRRGRSVREPLPGPVLLAGDHCGGGVADGQAAAQPVGFDIVVDQYGAAVLIADQAVQRQAEDVLGPAPGVDPDLSGDPHLGRLKGVQIGAQDRHDLRRQVTAT